MGISAANAPPHGKSAPDDPEDLPGGEDATPPSNSHSALRVRPGAIVCCRCGAPPERAAFRWLKLDDLDTARQATLMNAIKGIPRRPESLQQLLSPEFVARARSGELSELIMTEPMIAAKVLSTVNAPCYGMHTPVTSIGQAVTFLGINMVRNICLQYILTEAFDPRQATSQKAFDSVWLASASELCVRLSRHSTCPTRTNPPRKWCWVLWATCRPPRSCRQKASATDCRSAVWRVPSGSKV